MTELTCGASILPSRFYLYGIIMKKTLITLILLNNVAYAAEGMWMPQQLPEISKQLSAEGLKLNPKMLAKLNEFPMGAIVSLGSCSGSFVSPKGLVATNHHCVYASLAYNSTKEHDLIVNGFLAKNYNEELSAVPGSRIFVTKEVSNVTDKIISADVAQLNGKMRSDAIEKKQKKLVSECEKDAGHRCTVSTYYAGLEYYLVKQLEIRDVRLVHAPPSGVGKFGGDTENWTWPRHTGDYGFFRGYVSKDGRSADYNKDNIPYEPKHFLKLAKESVKKGDYVMAVAYPISTNRHSLPSEVAHTFGWSYPTFVTTATESLAIINHETKNNPDAGLKYASQVARTNNMCKNRQGMIDSYTNSDLLARKIKEHEELKTWVNANSLRRKEFSNDIQQIEELLSQRNAEEKRDFFFRNSQPRLLNLARTLYRLTRESNKPDIQRKAGYQKRDLPRIKAELAAVERSYDAKVDKALVMNNLVKYTAQPQRDRRAAFDHIFHIKDGMTQTELAAALDALYSGSKLGDARERMAWMKRTPDEFKASKDTFIKAAVALYDTDLEQENKDAELNGNIQQSNASYMKAKIEFMKTKGQVVYPDANSTLRVTFGHVDGRDHGIDGTTWSEFTTVNGITAKATGSGEYNAPATQLAAIKATDFGKYADPNLKTVTVDFLATMDVTGGNSGSAVLNGKGEFVGMVFDTTLDSIISDWYYNKSNARSIQVDLRYLLWNLKHVDKADNLLKEMNAP